MQNAGGPRAGVDGCPRNSRDSSVSQATSGRVSVAESLVSRFLSVSALNTSQTESERVSRKWHWRRGQQRSGMARQLTDFTGRVSLRIYGSVPITLRRDKTRQMSKLTDRVSRYSVWDQTLST
jgi:hypothetical protein